VGVLVNDMAALGVDGALVSSTLVQQQQQQQVRMSAHGSMTGVKPAAAAAVNDAYENHNDTRVVQLANGCICCGLKGDMLLVGVLCV
jgi:G3E family GTPase